MRSFHTMLLTCVILCGIALCLEASQSDPATSVTPDFFANVPIGSGAIPLGNVGSSGPFGSVGGSVPFGSVGGSVPLGNVGGSVPLGSVSGSVPFGNVGGSVPFGNAGGSVPLGNVGGSVPLGNGGSSFPGLPQTGNSGSSLPSPPSSSSGKTCCQLLPEICDSDGDCVLEYTVCAKLCMCVSGLPAFMCEHIFKELHDDAAMSSTGSPTDSSVLGNNRTTSSPKEPPPVELEPSTSLSPSETSSELQTSSGSILDASNASSGSSATPSLDVSPTTVYSTTTTGLSKTVSRDMSVDQKLMTPTYRTQTASTLFSSISQVNSTTPTPAAYTPQTGSSTGSSTSGDTDDRPNELPEGTTRDYSDFVPPVMDSTSPCENCTGTCLFDWNNIPMFVCEEGDNHKCDNFDCGDHGTCVENEEGYVNCECQSNYTGTFCDHLCNLNCGDTGTCNFLNKTMYCVCKWNYTGERCSDLRTTPTPIVTELRMPADSEPWLVIGASLVLVLVLFLLLVVLPYCTWRRRWLPMRKLVHYFQSYEDDDGKEFDAFVSYKSCDVDERFVVRTLYPKLEKELDFKLCMHFRDFPPGDTIADNIMHAVENSRRTIMLLSPSYVESEWCRLEYQKAQHEMLKRKHKIIPIMLEDISKVKDIDKNLKQILNTVTYIEWPGTDSDKKLDRFWKLMECALPKRKQDSGQSETSAGSSSSELPLTSLSGSHFPDTLSDEVFSNKKSTFTSNSDDFDIIEINNSKNRQCNGDAVINLNNEIQESNHRSDDHIVEIRKLPGNKLKMFRRFNMNLNFGSKTPSS